MNLDNMANNLRMNNKTHTILHKQINRLMSNLDKGDKTLTITIGHQLHVNYFIL